MKTSSAGTTRNAGLGEAARRLLAAGALVVGCSDSTTQSGAGQTSPDAAAEDVADDTGAAAPTLPSTDWTETIAPTAPVDDVEATYTPSGWVEALTEVYARRFAFGARLAELTPEVAEVSGPFVNNNTGSLAELLSRAGMVASALCEYQRTAALPEESTAEAVVVDPDAPIELARDAGKPTPPRSQVKGKLPAGSESAFDALLLEGQAGQADFGAQLGELACAEHGLLGALAGADGASAGAAFAEREEVAARMLHLAAYLKLLRTELPATHGTLLADPAARAAVDALTERGLFALLATAASSQFLLSNPGMESALAELVAELRGFASNDTENLEEGD
jgi:hypothetical protein